MRIGHRGAGAIGLAVGLLLVSAVLVSTGACSLRPLSRSLTRWGFMDTRGEIVIPLQFTRAGHFSGGLAGVEMDGHWGYVDRSGRFVIAPRFASVTEFAQERALVEVTPDRWRYIDPRGDIAISLDFRYPMYGRSFSEGVAAVFLEDARLECLDRVEQARRDDFDGRRGWIASRLCGRWGFIDRDGRVVIAPRFIEAFEFSEGLAAVRVQDPAAPDQRQWRYGYIDRQGALAIPPRFEAAFEFAQGRARVVVGGRYTFIDGTGRAMSEATFDDARDFHEGLAQVRIGSRWGYVDLAGTLAIPAEFVRTGRFSEGLASASRSGGLGGYIDRSGATIIPERFGVAWPFSDGRARVQIGDGRGLLDTWGYIDRSGTVVISRALKGGWPFREGLALVGNGGPI